MKTKHKIPLTLKPYIQKTALALRKFNDMFEQDLSNFNPDYEVVKLPDTTDKIHYVYWPWVSSREPNSGLTLKNNHGYITIVEMYREVNRREYIQVGFTYRYINPNHSYDVIFDNGTGLSKLPINSFNFRFDKNPVHPKTKNEPLEHLQVIQQVPRFEYPVGYINCNSFLETLKSTLYPLGQPMAVSFATSNL